MEQLSPLEKTLFECSKNQDEKLAIYQKYVDIEKEYEIPGRIQALHECIVAELPLHETLWTEYCKYLTGVPFGGSTFSPPKSL